MSLHLSVRPLSYWSHCRKHPFITESRNPLITEACRFFLSCFTQDFKLKVLASLPLSSLTYSLPSIGTASRLPVPPSLSRCLGGRGNFYDSVQDIEEWKRAGSHPAFFPGHCGSVKQDNKRYFILYLQLTSRESPGTTRERELKRSRRFFFFLLELNPSRNVKPRSHGQKMINVLL